MKRVSVIVPHNVVMATIDGPRQLFSAVNDFLAASGQPALFDVQFVGLSREVSQQDGRYTVHTDRLLKDVKKTDLIIIPALTGDITTALEANIGMNPWIVDQYNNGAEVVSLCIGAFFLANTGLLDGKKCSTHWMFGKELETRFPEVEVVEGSIITEDRGIYSSGGANSYWNLLLYLVEKYTDRRLAILASKYFAIEIDRNTQSPFTIFKGQKGHEDAQIKNVQEYIEANYQEKMSVPDLAAMFALSRRSFERRFKKATANTVVEYIQRVKIEAAKITLESERANVNEVVYSVGYTDPKAFRSTFKKITGLSPLQYRSKYSRGFLAD